MDYYEEIAAQAKALMDAGDFDAAFALLDVELKMPYIPKQQEEVLVAYYNRCRMERNAQKPIRRASLDQLEDLLNGSLDEQFQAVELLRGANVRMHMEVLRDALCREKLHYLVRAYLVEILIFQQLHEEITMVHEGLEVTFIPAFVEAPMESDGALMVIEQLKEWLENEDPSFLAMCVEAFIKEAYLQLPFNIEETEAFEIALAIVAYVYRAYDDHAGFEAFCETHRILSKGSYALLLDKHEI